MRKSSFLNRYFYNLVCDLHPGKYTNIILSRIMRWIVKTGIFIQQVMDPGGGHRTFCVCGLGDNRAPNRWSLDKRSHLLKIISNNIDLYQKKQVSSLLIRIFPNKNMTLFLYPVLGIWWECVTPSRRNRR